MNKKSKLKKKGFILDYSSGGLKPTVVQKAGQMEAGTGN